MIFDPRPDSKTQGKIKEYELGRPNHYMLIQVPPMVWYGFQTIGGQTALIANCSDQPHNPEEKESLDRDWWGYLFLAPVVSTLTNYNLIISLFSSTIRWRGVCYDLKSKDEVHIRHDTKKNK